jgi:ProP effector
MHFDKRIRMQKAHAERVRNILVTRFPDCFAPKGEAKKPLKLGIGFDLLLALPELSSYSVNIALEDYTSGRKYCEALIPGAPRYSLDGFEAGIVSALEADHARKRIEAFERGAEAHKPREETVSP